MVHIDKVKHGLARYIEVEMLPKMHGADAWLTGIVSALLIEHLGEIMKEWHNNSIVKAMHIMDENGNVNLEKIYPLALAQSRRTGPIKMELPLIGTITLAEADIEHIYQRIMSA